MQNIGDMGKQGELFEDVEFAGLCDEALVHEVERVANNVSYYNAAEGPDWQREAVGRQSAKQRLHRLRQELDRRGLKVDFSGYLL